jgi:hypothetical protein
MKENLILLAVVIVGVLAANYIQSSMLDKKA